MKTVLAGLTAAVLVVSAEPVFAGKGGNVIKQGRSVTFEYTLTVDGKVVDSSAGRKPLQYTQGDGKIIPGLSRQMEGLEVGDQKEIVVAPQEAYGQVDPKAFQEVPKSRLPQDVPMTIGTQLQAKGENGKTLIATVAEVKKETVVMNFNHPLAGKELHFQVKILEIK